MDNDNKLRRDAEILQAMADEMGAYLDSNVLFWPLGPTMPQLTLGGYLMREQRLLALKDKLDGATQGIVNTAIYKFNTALAERIVRFEKKAEEELGARLRQWQAALNDYQRKQGMVNYGTAVEARLMIHLLLDKLSLPPYQLPAQHEKHVRSLDNSLADIWQKGPFVWSDSWQDVYSANEFWWLYGSPR